MGETSVYHEGERFAVGGICVIFAKCSKAGELVKSKRKRTFVSLCYGRCFSDGTVRMDSGQDRRRLSDLGQYCESVAAKP